MSKRHAAQVRVRLRYPDVETFIEKFSINISRGGIFVRTREPREKGTIVRFEFQLHDGTPVFRGEGEVVWIKSYDPDRPSKAHGMGLKFRRLDRHSRRLIDRLLEHKEKAKDGVDGPDSGDEPVGASDDPPAEPEEFDEVDDSADADDVVEEAEELLAASDEDVEHDGSGEEALEKGGSADGEAAEEGAHAEETPDSDDLVHDAAGPAGSSDGEEVGLPFDDRAGEEFRRSVKDVASPGGAFEELLDMPVDVGAAISRGLGGSPMAPEDCDDALDELEPEGFETAAAIERFHDWAGGEIPPSVLGLSPGDEGSAGDDEPQEGPAQEGSEALASEPGDVPSAEEAEAEPAADEAETEAAADEAETEAAADEAEAEGEAPADEAEGEGAADEAEGEAAADEAETEAVSGSEPDPVATEASVDDDEASWDAFGDEENLLDQGTSDGDDGLFGSDEIPELLDDLLMGGDEGAALDDVPGAESGPDLVMEESSAAADVAAAAAVAGGEPLDETTAGEQAPGVEAWPEVEGQVVEDPYAQGGAYYRGEPIMPGMEGAEGEPQAEPEPEPEPEPASIEVELDGLDSSAADYATAAPVAEPAIDPADVDIDTVDEFEDAIDLTEEIEELTLDDDDPNVFSEHAEGVLGTDDLDGYSDGLVAEADTIDVSAGGSHPADAVDPPQAEWEQPYEDDFEGEDATVVQPGLMGLHDEAQAPVDDYGGGADPFAEPPVAEPEPVPYVASPRSEADDALDELMADGPGTSAEDSLPGLFADGGDAELDASADQEQATRLDGNALPVEEDGPTIADGAALEPAPFPVEGDRGETRMGVPLRQPDSVPPEPFDTDGPEEQPLPEEGPLAESGDEESKKGKGFFRKLFGGNE